MKVTISPDRHVFALDLHPYISTSLERYQFDDLPFRFTPILHTARFDKSQSPKTLNKQKEEMIQYPFR